ncbi:MAG: GlsB/YeaQ/YmgE family stress response membrane protein [Acidimicrobiia bacterium]|nr:GlsB/YeaQ/YmgE family stress response membrane protein [Acidimicrobiia bacterium]
MLWLLIVGLIVGLIARFLVPGPDPMGLLATMVLGVVGSFVGGLILSLLTEGELALTTSGWIGSIVGAIVALLIYRAVQRRRA